jgi:hypothetical protein
VCLNVSDQDKETADMEYLLYGKVSEGKNRVDFTIANMVKKMAMFLKYKSKTMLRHSNDPVALIHAMMKTGHQMRSVLALCMLALCACWRYACSRCALLRPPCSCCVCLLRVPLLCVSVLWRLSTP